MKKKTLESLKVKQVNNLSSKKVLSSLKGGDRSYNSDEGERLDI